ncbi:protein S100-P [Xiphophorus maculatus]|uniref:S100 calcium binding protein P n=1 Tax=Xiphophorus maculatus TaxID=8083 RepID=M4AAE1_XIPMA|nr:protein S100-P [Xiphophorus maculatus]XP_027893136.1 protein S100-P [Xiphophorus couchianus]XP_032437943.1 protein S100-P-like [Xiphophorus hellerii]
MSQLEMAMATLIQTFDKYAGSDGKKSTLSKTEVKTLMEKELPGLLKAAKNPGEVDKFLKGLDFNGDAEVDFQEFVTLVVALTCAAHSRFCKQ